MDSLLIKNATLVNEGTIKSTDIQIRHGRIDKIAGDISIQGPWIDVEGQWLLPGVIDDQVHFREPGLTHKATIASESRAGISGGVTSFMEMPNTKPPAITQALLEDKFQVAKETSWANYSFFMGTTNDNLEEVLQTNPESVCGVKVFMGSSTGNMLVDQRQVLEQLFREVPMLIATHCEDEETIRMNLEKYKFQFGKDLSAAHHPLIRSAEGCLKSSQLAVGLARQFGTRLHVLHLSTADELGLFEIHSDLARKKITSEVCVHHLHFNSNDYSRLGNRIKCNPAIKGEEHRKDLWKALLDDRIDIIATDHAPHTAGEKELDYLEAPSGLPLLQHSLAVMLDYYHQGIIPIEKIVEKMCHAPAVCFRIKERGFVREGYWADLILVDPVQEWIVSKENILYKCGWSPFEGKKFKGRVKMTIVNGKIAYDREKGFLERNPERMEFHPVN